MSSDLEPSSPFETLSDDPILHIFSYLPGADLLHLSEMDKNFKRIITESTETMSKIRLVLDFDDKKDLDLDYAIKLAQTRRFTGLRLKSVKVTDAKAKLAQSRRSTRLRLNSAKLADANAKVKLVSILELLSGSVDDLIVEGEISRELLSSIMASFLPKLEKCKLDGVETYADATPINEEISSQSTANHPLQSLELKDTHASEVLQLFTGCNQLKTFCYYAQNVYAGYGDDLHMNDFLVRQDHLEKLDHSALDHSPELEWNRLRCFKLKELTAHCPSDTDEELAAVEFLKKLPKLTVLNIGIIDHPSRHLMKAICQIPKLDELTVRSWKDEDADEDEDEDEDGDEDEEEFLKGLVNRTVKNLSLIYHSGHKAKLLKFFEVFESAWMCTIIENPNDMKNLTFHHKFSPRIIPKNVGLFQSFVTIFWRGMLSGDPDLRLIGVEIGHSNWRNNGAFRLSNSFCEGLVNQIPKLRKLEIYNIADRKRFISFLHKNEDRLSLEDVKIHEPFVIGEPEPKKMKIQID